MNFTWLFTPNTFIKSANSHAREPLHLSPKPFVNIFHGKIPNICFFLPDLRLKRGAQTKALTSLHVYIILIHAWNSGRHFGKVFCLLTFNLEMTPALKLTLTRRCQTHYTAALHQDWLDDSSEIFLSDYINKLKGREPERERVWGKGFPFFHLL